MTREEEKKTNPLSIGSTNQDADGDQLKAQVMSNRQALLSQLSANQPGVRPEDESEFEQEAAPVPESVVPSPAPAPTPPDPPPPAPVVESTMGRVVEVIFDTLQSNCADANRALAGSEAQLNCQKPAGVQMRTSPQTGASVQAMRGNVSLPNYSLVVDCTDERILVFIIPSEFLLGFDPESELFTPHLVLRQIHREGQSAWFMDNTPVGNVMLPELARQLLRNLIAVARGEANPKQPFAFGKPAPIAAPAPAAVVPARAAAPVPPGMAGVQTQAPAPAPAPAPIAAPAPAPVAAGASSYSQSLSRSQTVKQLMVGALDEPRREPMPFYVAPAPEAPSPEPPSNGGATSAPAPAPMPPQAQAQTQVPAQAPPAERRRADIRETNEFAMLSELISKDKSAPSPQISPVRSVSQSDEMWQRPESATPPPPPPPPVAPIPPGRARPSSPAPMPAPAPAPTPPPAPAETGSGNFRVPSDLFESQDSVPQIESAVSAQNAFPVPPGHMVPPESLPATAPAPEPAPADASLSEVSGVQPIPEIPFSMPIPTPAPVPASEQEPIESAPESAAMSGPSEAASPSIQPVEPSLSRMDAPLEEKSEGLLSKVIAESAGESEEAPGPSFKSLKSLISAGDEEESAPPKAELSPPVGIEAPSSSLQALLSDTEEDEVLPPPPVQPAEETPAAPVPALTKSSAEAAGDLGKLVTDTEKQLFEGCDQLMNNLERALATLKSAGVEAMQDDNIEQVTEIMNHTKRLKTLRDRLAALKVEID